MTESEPAEPRPVYLPMVYIIIQRKKINQRNLKHIGVPLRSVSDTPLARHSERWVAYCKADQEHPSKCEYQYKTTLDQIDCPECVSRFRRLGWVPGVYQRTFGQKEQS